MQQVATNMAWQYILDVWNKKEAVLKMRTAKKHHIQQHSLLQWFGGMLLYFGLKIKRGNAPSSTLCTEKQMAAPKIGTANHHLRGIRQLSGSPVYYPIQL